jgi:acyl dehydratase
LKSLKGASLGFTDWIPVTQEQIDLFAKATGDHQWIHTDPARAAKESPFRKTIAHGYFTLGLVPACLYELMEVTGARLIINYGANKVRWPGPVPIPSRVRVGVRVSDIEELDKGYSAVLDATVEVEGQQKPALAAQVLYRYYA